MVVHSAPVESVETLGQHICVPDKPFATAPTPSKGCDSPGSDVSIRALLQVEDILNICCELRLDEKNKTVINLGTCTVDVLCQSYVKHNVVKVFVVECNL